MISKGSVALTEMFEKRGTQHQTAESMNIKASLLIRWRRGEQKPDSRYRALIEDKLGIPWRSWDDPVDSAEPPEEPDSTEPAPDTISEPEITQVIHYEDQGHEQ